MSTKKIQILNGASIIPKSDWNQTDDTKADYIKNKPTNVSQFNNDSNYLTIDTTDGLYGSTISVDIDPQTYICTFTLKNNNGETISTSTVDLPLESMVVNGEYDVDNKKVILTLKSGDTVEFSIADLVSGLVSRTDIVNNLTSTNSDKPLSAAQGKALNENKADKQNSDGGFEGGEGASAITGGAIGKLSSAGLGGAIGFDTTTADGFAGGKKAIADGGGAVGCLAIAGNGFAGGQEAKTIDTDNNPINAIQLGTGTNNTEKTLQVYDYTLMNADGSIPAERLNNAPKTEELERLQYYGDKDIVPSDSSYFTVNATGETITGLTDTGKTQTGTLVIPYKINGVEITEIGIKDLDPTYSGEYNNFNKIVLPNTITSISDGAFWNCESITSINIPDSVTYIGSFAFSSTALTSINLPDGAAICEYAFQNCTSLTTISIPNINSSIDTNTFYGCTSLTSIEIPSTVTSISDDAFTGITPANLTVYCEQGSYAETYAKENGFNIVYTDIDKDTIDELVKMGFDGTITTSLLSDKVNCPRTIGVFKVLKSEGNIAGVLISTASGTATEATHQLYIIPSIIGTMQVRWRKYNTTANEWSDWDIQRPRLTTLNPNTSPVSLNSIYAINQTGTHSNVIVNLPEGKVGDFVQYDFVTGTTAPTVIIQSVYGMTEFDFTPEANKIYSLFFDWGIIAVSNTENTYGWRISFAEYDYDANVAEVLPEENL